MMQEMEALLDKERLLKYQSMKEGRAKALCLGAGVLLRLAWAESQSGAMQVLAAESVEAPKIFTPGEVMERLKELPLRTEPRYCYGEKGKPYFKDSPLSFSLSHSEDLVFCAIADHEIGVDVQRITEVRWEKLAERYFSPQEQDYLGVFAKDRAGCFRLSKETSKQEFFRLWSRKEAFGKMTGEGAAQYLGQSFLEEEEGFSVHEGMITLRDVTYCYCIYEQDREGK
ncbi:MAG: 4'-phosphopantetheinyl transferase superfamily protein [Lachnospiraceae bacterium]|nr:4'-phosphopantetheinyl transferase superfamily protein [Lachnospiraceae bacterium]